MSILIKTDLTFFFIKIKHSHTKKQHYHLFITNHPVNLSISFTGGKEIKWDTLSNGEWKGYSAKLKSQME